MANFSNYLEDALINGTLRATNFTAPTTIYLALYTSDPTDADTGTEVTGGSYARQTVAFDAPSGGVTQNTAQVLFPTATANWGTVTHIGLRDAVSGGNLLYHDALNTPRTVNSGNQITLAAGQLTVTLD